MTKSEKIDTLVGVTGCSFAALACYLAGTGGDLIPVTAVLSVGYFLCILGGRSELKLSIGESVLVGAIMTVLLFTALSIMTFVFNVSTMLAPWVVPVAKNVLLGLSGLLGFCAALILVILAVREFIDSTRGTRHFSLI